MALATGLLLVWSNLAVGLIGSEENPANLLYFGVIAIAVTGIAVTRFRPGGVSRVLFVTAFAQALPGPIAAAAGWAPAEPGWPREIALLSLVFCGLWLLSAGLFRKAAREQR